MENGTVGWPCTRLDSVDEKTRISTRLFRILADQCTQIGTLLYRGLRIYTASELTKCIHLARAKQLKKDPRLKRINEPNWDIRSSCEIFRESRGEVQFGEILPRPGWYDFEAVAWRPPSGIHSQRRAFDALDTWRYKRRYRGPSRR